MRAILTMRQLKLKHSIRDLERTGADRTFTNLDSFEKLGNVPSLPSSPPVPSTL